MGHYRGAPGAGHSALTPVANTDDFLRPGARKSGKLNHENCRLLAQVETVHQPYWTYSLDTPRQSHHCHHFPWGRVVPGSHVTRNPRAQ
ncbi:hypothetical protein LshimejAT787_0704650 [Lyophyllum shimeji]|uniref:Uncharacterized protein n=1 Tax=Lyophyllum shimeji TaxID=47721 RepID=A0A9P3UQA1_LYOSH|nr:hypothetical protein LshimejAT787_0704650 [Lyophyllum shimeji]